MSRQHDAKWRAAVTVIPSTTRLPLSIARLRRNWLPPVHRGFGDNWHRARWSLYGQGRPYVEGGLRNPWSSGRWIMDMQECSTCHELRSRVLRRDPRWTSL